MRAVPVVMVALALAACDPVVPESGVGFGDYSQYLRERERALAAGTPPPAPIVAPVAGPPAATGFSTDRAAAAIDAADGRTAAAPGPVAPLAGAALDATDPNRPRGDAPTGIKVERGEVQGGNHATISDEQDFDAVAARETIESDAERIARNRAQYQVDQPTALPQRQGGSGPNIVSFALSTTHAPGTPVYRRSGFGGNGSACGRYGSTDLAQEAFLSEGGPERDRKGLDPDGDGFACGWDPRPFRAAKAVTPPSPNFGERRGGLLPDIIVIHYTAMATCAEARARLCDPAAEVSAHWLVSETGEAEMLVPEEMRAWHAGAGEWAGVADVNSRSVGIELANPGDAPFPMAQMAALERLLTGIMGRWQVPPHRVIGHSDMAPARKRDPGRRFDWRGLARAGLSVWPAAGSTDPRGFAAAARPFGYPDEPPDVLLRAFRLRFRPWATGPADETDAGMAGDLAARFPVDAKVPAA